MLPPVLSMQCEVIWHVGNIDIDMLPPVLSMQCLLAGGPMMCMLK